MLLEHADELVADRLALGLGFGDAGQAGEEPVAGVDVDQLDAHRAAERVGDLLALALAHQPGVDVDARQLVADGPVDQRRRDRRVDPARQPADGPAVADLGADAGDLLVDHRGHRPRGRQRRPLVQEPPQHAHAVRRVDDLGMELHAVDPPPVVLQRGDRGVVGRRRRDEAVRHLGDGVEVAHPDVVDVRRVVGQQQRVGGAAQLGPPVLAAHAAADGAAELLGDQLGAVADAQDRDAELVDRRVERRRTVDVDALGTAGQDQRRRPALGDLGGGDAVGHDLRVHGQFAHPAGDQLGVLGTEVDDEDGVLVFAGLACKALIVDSAARNLPDAGQVDRRRSSRRR